jgi:hypothetical protein
MKFRRLMQIARRGQSLPKGSVVSHSKIALPMTIDRVKSGTTQSEHILSALASIPDIKMGHGKFETMPHLNVHPNVRFGG